MMKPDIQENLMRRYLLGDLPESETNELEIQVLRDDEKFEEMWEIENRLVDGTFAVDGIGSQKFEHHYQALRSRQRVACQDLLKRRTVSAPFPPRKGSWAEDSER